MKTYTMTVAAVKASKHGSYGKQLASVTVTFEGPDITDDASKYAVERQGRALATVQFKKMLPGLKLTTDLIQNAVEVQS
jgi:hypothetical protein